MKSLSTHNIKIKKGDNVFVITGKDKGKTGIVQKVMHKNNALAITGINVAKKHLKPSKKNPHGGIVDMVKPINASNVLVFCPNCSKPARIGYKINNDQKERVCRKCGVNLDVKEKNVKA